MSEIPKTPLVQKLENLGLAVAWLFISYVAINLALKIGQRLLPGSNELTGFAVGTTAMIITTVIIMAFQKANKK
ncbi:MAG: hypothetical protein WCK60_01780 [Candidatus Nomurabacteria bacterium]